MKIRPSNVFDLLLGHFPPSISCIIVFTNHKKLALDTIFTTLEVAARKFLSAEGKTSTLIVDGSDLIAKHEVRIFIHLVSHAKRLANASILSLVFVSSEGVILPITQGLLSGVTRYAKTLEVGDIEDHADSDYLVTQGVPQHLANKFVDYAGGRFVYLVKIAALYLSNQKIYPR